MRTLHDKYENIKISIIVPIYNSEKYLERCLESLVNQTYKNLEIILVNDASTGNAKEICKLYQEKDPRIKYYEHKENNGLFKSRVTGMENATGDYIAFCDSDDFVSNDFYRVMLFKAVETNADITIANTVIQRNDGSKFVYNLRTNAIDELDGDNCFIKFLKQEGLNFSWHTVWNKLYSKKIINLALPVYKKQTKHLNMCEDIAISLPLFFYAKKVRSAKSVSYIYCQNGGALTDATSKNLKKVKKDISDLILVFEFLGDFLRENRVEKKYLGYFNAWKETYNRSWTETIKSSQLEENEKERAFSLLSQLVKKRENIIPEDYYFSSLFTEWNQSFDNLKQLIIDEKIKYVSFDVFDTAICRPFLYPSDLFIFLNKTFESLIGKTTLIEFSEMRQQSESEIRAKVAKQEVTIDEIYRYLSEKYNIPQDITDNLKKEEIRLEKQFSLQRESIYEIYQMCLYLGKKVIFTSDNYLSSNVISNLLLQNGYDVYDRLYVSSEIGLTKSTRDLFTFILKDLDIRGEEIIHIGDNYAVDYENAKISGLQSFYYPKCQDVFFGLTSLATNSCGAIFTNRMRIMEDNRTGLEFLGIRSMLAVISKKYFDNPFPSFNPSSDFNGDPYFLGYYVLGMYVFAITNWLLKDLEENQKKNIAFMARDGYLFKKVFDILAPTGHSKITTNYLHMSRKALIPFLINNRLDWYKLSNSFINFEHTGTEILKYLDFTLDSKKLQKKEKIYKTHGIKIDDKLKSKEEFDRFINITYKNFFDKKKYEEFLNSSKKYFSQELPESTAIFDVGYSGKPEFVLSSICGRQFDTYFVNINRDEPLKNAQKGGFTLKTFFSYRPLITGLISESLVSELAPSCISYEKVHGDIKPVFEQFAPSYQEQFLIEEVQTGAVDFAKDVVKIFGEQMSELYYQDFYACLPYSTFISSSRYFDKAIFSPLRFEDDLGGLKTFKLLDLWNDILSSNKALSPDELFERSSLQLEYKPNLSGRSRLIKLVYYLLYDRGHLKEIIKAKIHNKVLLKILSFEYKMLRKGKKLIYYTLHPKCLALLVKSKLQRHSSSI